MSHKNLLSILLIVRDDNYTKNYLERLSYNINLNLFNIVKSGLSDSIKIEVVDWGSKTPVSTKIKLKNKNFRNIIDFIYVDYNTANNFNNYSLGSFFVELGCNIGFRRSTCKYILNCPADQFFTQKSLINLYNFLILEKDKDKFYIIQRKILDEYFYYENKFSFNVINDFVENFNFLTNPINSNRIYYGGGLGAILASKKNYFQVFGYDENSIFRGRYSGSDGSITKKFLAYYKYKTLLPEGVCMYKLPYSVIGLRNNELLRYKKIIKIRQYFYFSRNFNKNKFNKLISSNLNFNKELIKKENWGIPDRKFSLQKAKCYENNQFDFEFTSKNIIDQSIIKLNNFNKKFNRIKLYLKLVSTSFHHKQNFQDFKFLLTLINIIKTTNILGYYEINSNNVNRIYSLSKIFPYMKIVLTLINNNSFGDIWFYLSSRICNTHKGYFRAIPKLYSEKKNLYSLFSEIVLQEYSNIILVNNFLNTKEKNYFFFNLDKNFIYFSIIILYKEINLEENNNLFVFFKPIYKSSNFQIFINKKLFTKNFTKIIELAQNNNIIIIFTYIFIRVLSFLNNIYYKYYKK